MIWFQARKDTLWIQSAYYQIRKQLVFKKIIRTTQFNEN